MDEWFSRISAAAERGDIEGAKEAWLSTGWFAPALEKPDVARKLRAIAAGYTGWHFQNKNPAQFLEPVANDRLEEILAPTLVVVGELDLDFYNLPMAEVLSKRINNARTVVSPEAGHMSNMENPPMFNEACCPFLHLLIAR